MAKQAHNPAPGKTSPTTRETYNMVTDTIAGPNIRLKDNLLQGLAVLVCLILGAGIGALLSDPWFIGAALGAVAGMILGVLTSGIVIMIYRGVMHAQGKHD
ncbi:MAG: hypothetical protein AAGC72_03810 [Planctomycetota bacterium]